MKKTFVIITSILFIWFTFDMTGLHIGDNIIVEKACLSADGVFWIVFVIGIILFIKNKKAGLIYLMSYYILWLISQFIFTIQYMIFSNQKRILSYNIYFQNTHHIIKPSDKLLIPDTYHIVLLSLIVITVIISIIYSFNNKKTYSDI